MIEVVVIEGLLQNAADTRRYEDLGQYKNSLKYDTCAACQQSVRLKTCETKQILRLWYVL